MQVQRRQILTAISLRRTCDRFRGGAVFTPHVTFSLTLIVCVVVIELIGVLKTV